MLAIVEDLELTKSRPRTDTDFDHVEQCDIHFVHFRDLPRADELPQLRTRLKRLLPVEDDNAIIVTLPDRHTPVSSALRYDFETLVLDLGGQLCFVRYESGSNEERAEWKYRDDMARFTDPGTDDGGEATR